MLRYCVVSYSPLVAEYDATRGFVTMFSVFCCHSSWVGWLELSRCFFSCTREGWGINSCLDRLPNDPPPPPPQPETCSGIVFESSSGLEKSHISTAFPSSVQEDRSACLLTAIRACLAQTEMYSCIGLNPVVLKQWCVSWWYLGRSNGLAILPGTYCICEKYTNVVGPFVMVGTFFRSSAWRGLKSLVS